MDNLELEVPPVPQKKAKWTSKASSQPWVPVVSSTGKPLMPCRPARARRFIEQGRAVKKWKNRLFYIQMLDREDGITQPVAVGVDPGSKREGFTVKAAHKTFVNIQAHAVNGDKIKESLKERREARRARRYRKTPCRQPRYYRTRSKDWLPPSTKARWQHKLNILMALCRLYPVTHIVVEDVKAVTKEGKKGWNNSFSPVQTGKNWFYKQLELLGLPPILHTGMETSAMRQSLGLIKTSQKLSETFEAHCVDSWVLANSVVRGHDRPDLTSIYTLVPLRTSSRRQLHFRKPKKGNIRPRYGGTMSLGIKKFTMVKDPKRGLCLVGGNDGKDRVSLHSIDGYSRLCQNAKPENLQLISYAPWYIKGNKNPDTVKEEKKAKLNTKLIDVLFREYGVDISLTKFKDYLENLEMLRSLRCNQVA